MSSSIAEPFDPWDPLESAKDADPGILVSAQRREILNILKSYTGYYDLFSELIQNALDAVEKRLEEGEDDFQGRIWIEINLSGQWIRVTVTVVVWMTTNFGIFYAQIFLLNQVE